MRELVTDSASLRGAFSPSGCLLIYLALYGNFFGVLWLLITFAPPSVVERWWTLTSAVSIFATLILVLYLRPKILLISRWHASYRSFLYGLLGAVCVLGPTLMLTSFPELASKPPPKAFLGAVLLAPLLEETLFRGILLGSLMQHWEAKWSILVVSIAAASAESSRDRS